jgi:hypothetical protein
VSRQSDAKKARRRKRQAARDSSWIAAPAFEELPADDSTDAIGDAIAGIDEWITARGWVLDIENAQDLVSWVYPPSAAEFDDPPSAAEFDDEDREPVTRIWITAAEDDDEVVLEFGAVLVGAAGDDESYVLDPDTLAEGVWALEGYRLGSLKPEFV